ncbi:GNAT family N-acetyltransferase [Proteinivorax tanatarense]|uniref:GNAT family N-acetyltransferase n=1 Tax=Proteinivorax tanatarense TaxID=1260629 RepID=UPI0033132145
MTLQNSNDPIGNIDIRIGYNENIYYGGHIGYGIDEAYRGTATLQKLDKILKQVATSHGMNKMIITCNPGNWPSRRTCEKAGLKLKEIADLRKSPSANATNRRKAVI